ncbi:hypothetical protein [Hyphomicrobium sp.]|uniref:hypothetical protein n=1 Tax=Hyphomicrobium sp. TaxID=82 RepID=UPI0025BFCA66|nr:hypothetical protein [Hyphomicrobium sp.]MCC7253319.1 hypothetical protein [Hyphomicrobium sp.]
MTTIRAIRASILTLAISLAATAATAAPAEHASSPTTSIGNAIAARIIAIKCNRPMLPTTLTQAEIGELDTFIDERQTAFMMESKANQRLSEMVFPQLARDYNQLYSTPDACDATARHMAKATLQQVREVQAGLKQRAEVKQ